jgi:hypothetical protein
MGDIRIFKMDGESHPRYQIPLPCRGRNGGGTVEMIRFQSNASFNQVIPIPHFPESIAIENPSGKNDDRFSDQNRSAISGSKSDPDFHFKIDPRSKTFFRIQITDGAQNRDPFSVRKSDPDFQIKIDQRFSF